MVCFINSTFPPYFSREKSRQKSFVRNCVSLLSKSKSLLQQVKKTQKDPHMGVRKRETRRACPSKMRGGPAHFGLSCCGGCATRGFPPSRAQNRPAFAALRFFALAPVHPRCSARLRISLYAPQGRGNHSHAPKYAFQNCVLLPYRIGRSGVASV